MKLPAFKNRTTPTQLEADDVSEERYFLNEELDGNSQRTSRTALQQVKKSASLIAIIVLLTSNLLGWSLLFVQSKPTSTRPFVISPLQNVIRDDVVRDVAKLGVNSKYAMDNEEADELWRKISLDGGGGWLVVTKDDLQEVNQTSIPLSDGSGYLVGIEVFHELHCLNYFRRRILGQNFRSDEDPFPELHFRHCLDILRMSIQCHSDVSLMPLMWIEDWPMPWPEFHTTRQCRNFDKILEWWHGSSVDAFSLLVHPHLGPIHDLMGHFDFPDLDDIRYIPEQEW